MTLNDLLADFTPIEISGDTSCGIVKIEPNSKKIDKGSLFVAIKGLTVDSHDFISEVIEKGAVAVIGERDPEKEWLEKTVYIKVENSREALGIIASTWYGNPSQKLKVIGVTGTEGKTTTCNLIYHILKESGKKVGLISTINAKIAGKDIDTGLHTTSPEALPLQNLLSQMVEAECEYAVIETTSMALHQGRVAGVKYDVGVLTNITQDHLDYHGTQEKYMAAKAILFQRCKVAVLNKDDYDSWIYMMQQESNWEGFVDYGILDQEPSEYDDPAYKANNIMFSPVGTEFTLKHYQEEKVATINTSLLGDYNISNTLAAIATVHKACDLTFDEITKALATFVTPEGRLERIEIDGHPPAGGFSVFVDFAHTPGALENVLSTLAKVKQEGKKLIAVYGAAGARDAVKRPAMGEAGGKHADITIFTADDPRMENVSDICEDLARGIKKTGATQAFDTESLEISHDMHMYYIEPDREKAIQLAISLARAGDIVALLGKGHEKSLAVGGEELPWSDQMTARNILKEMEKHRN